MGELENEEVNQLVAKLLSDYGKGRDIDKMAVYNSQTISLFLYKLCNLCDVRLICRSLTRANGPNRFICNSYSLFICTIESDRELFF